MPASRTRRPGTWVLPIADEDEYEPPPLDLSVPSVARLYNYALGGKDNLPVDREAFEDVLAVFPRCRESAQANRRFRERAVAGMARRGIAQFVDLGAGLPLRPSLHEVAEQYQPRPRAVYVDNDAMVACHARAHLATRPGIEVELLDLTDVDAVLASPGVASAIDLAEPVGLICTGVLHFLPQERARDVVARYREALPAGSMLALSLLAHDPERGTTLDIDGMRALSRWNVKLAADPISIHVRTPAEVRELFDGFELEEPGVVASDDWPTPRGSGFLHGLVGVGRLAAQG